MRRWLFMAALAAALLSTPVWAQRGGHGGVGGGGVHGGSAGAVHSGAGFAGAPRTGSWAGGVHGGFGHGPYPGHLPYYPGRYPYYGWRYPRWGYPAYYGYGWYGYPWWGWSGGVGWSSDYYPSGWYSDPSTQYPVYVYANPDNYSSAYDQQQEIDQLNNEVARLREQQSGAAQNYAPPSAPKAEIHGDTVLVFRDGHSEQIQNYAIVGKTLWVFTEQRARKIPIAELNIPATTKANEARGIDFRLPGQ